MKKLLFPCLLMSALAVSAQSYTHTVDVDNLGRGAIALPSTSSGIFVSWRSLASDDKAMTYDVYRNDTKLNPNPLSVTNFYDASGKAGDSYEVRCYVGDNLVDSQSFKAWDSQYLKVHLDRPAGGTSPSGGSNADPVYTYTPDDVSVGDVDGDGEYELFVKWFPTNAADNSFYRYTGNTLIDCYKLDGTKLWRIDLGQNIRSGNHYTQFMVWDFDGDGKAEMIVKTAPGTIDGLGNPVLMGSDKVSDDYRNSQGHVISGPEYLTVFNGLTGAQVNTIAYNPPRTIRKFDKSSSGWGDSYGGRSERYLACVAYLDGVHPSAVFCRGYYTASYLWAVDFDGSKLTERWLHKSESSGSNSVYGQGAHSLTVGDVDADGFDEIIYGAGAVDHDGKFLHTTGLGHGDALHLGAMIPDREGLQAFMPHEEKSAKYCADLRDARTGEILYFTPGNNVDNGRGLAANILPAPGYEYWSSQHRVPENQGVAIGTKNLSVNFRIFWDGDLRDELLDGTTITKPNTGNTSTSTLKEFSGYSSAASCNSTKKTPNLQADLFGDWREEVILHDGSTESDLLIFSTVTPTQYRVTSLMQNRQYREAIAWQNVAYNQPPHLSYNLEEEFNTAASISITEGNPNQVVNIGDSMVPVKFTIKRATGVTLVSGPEWLKVDFDEATLSGTITGKPTVEGEFSYKLQTTGASDNNNYTLEGKIVAHRSAALTLMAYYAFDNNGDSTPNAIYGEALAYDGAGATVPGKKGNALSLNRNYYVQKAYDGLVLGDADFTVEFWMQSKASAGYLLHKGSIAADASTGATGNWMGIELKNNTLKFAIDDDVTKTGIDVAEADKWFDGEWHQIVAVRDTYVKKLYLYVDGQLVGESDDATGYVNCTAEDLVIGNVNVTFNNPFVGALDELSIYRGAMTASKVLERFNTTGAELAYLPMDVLSETTPNLVFGEAKKVGEGLELVAGLKGGAIKFNNSAYLQQQAYDAIQMGENDFSIEFWMQSTDADGYIFFKGSHANNASAGTTGHWIGIERKNGYLAFTIDDDVKKTDCKLANADAYFDGKWHHVVAVRSYADKSMFLYIDGALVTSVIGSVSTTGINDNNEPMLIGNSDETAREFEGVIDELIIHPTAMSADEVAEAYALLKDQATGVVDITAEAYGDAHFYLVNATTGIIVREAVGADRYDLVDGIAPGVYLLVIDNGVSLETYKVVK